MKIFGSNKNSKHGSAQHAPARKASAPKAEGSGKKLPGKRLRTTLIVLAVVVVVILGAVIGYSMWEAPPDIAPSAAATPTPEQAESPSPSQNLETPEPSDSPDPSQDELNTPSPTPELDAEPLTTERNDGVYTFLVVGRDKGSNSTDTIIVGKFDTEAHTIDMVNIPRDTLVNIGWSGTPKKLNAIYPGYINSGKDGVEGLLQQIKNLLGYDVDFYAVVNIDMVIQVIDALGGVDFDVPIDMHYEDDFQGFSVHLSKGYQHLNGTQAMGVFRFRQGGWYQGVKYGGYPRGDLQRIETQQALLMALAGQMLDLGNIPNLKNIIDICVNNVQTTLSASNMAFFARQFLKCSKDDINFHSVGIGSSTAINGISFVSLPINDWLDIVNEYLSPYKDPITRKNVNMIATSNGYTIESTLGYVAGGFESFYCVMCTSKHGTTQYHAAGMCPPDPSEEPEVSASPDPSESPVVSASPETSPTASPEGGTTSTPTPSTPVESTPPADGGETTPPADGGETTPPADGGGTTPPADGGGTTPPADGG